MKGLFLFFIFIALSLGLFSLNETLIGIKAEIHNYNFEQYKKTFEVK